jgi:voltage-gated potassium channel Kch
MKFVFSQLAFFLTEAELRRNVRALLKYIAFLVFLIVLFSVLFHVIMSTYEGEEHSWITGLYWTLTVMSTLGFGDITFQSDVGRLFSIVVLLSGILLLLVMLPFLLIRFFYAPWLEARVKMRTPREIRRDVRDHVVICAWESMAMRLVHRLKRHGIPYVVIEPDPVLAARMYEDRIPVVLGDIDAKETYQKVHVERARLVFTNADDPTNTNITLTVREIAADMPISAVASFPESEDVIELAGATHVLPLPRRLGEHLANRVNAGHALPRHRALPRSAGRGVPGARYAARRAHHPPDAAARGHKGQHRGRVGRRPAAARRCRPSPDVDQRTRCGRHR